MEYIQLAFALIGIIALIILFCWVLGKLNKGILKTGGKRLKVLDKITLGGEKAIVVVSITGRCMVLGVTAGKIEKLEDLELTEEQYLELINTKDEGQPEGFFPAFKQAFAQNVKGLRKGGDKGGSAGRQGGSSDRGENPTDSGGSSDRGENPTENDGSSDKNSGNSSDEDGSFDDILRRKTSYERNNNSDS